VQAATDLVDDPPPPPPPPPQADKVNKKINKRNLFFRILFLILKKVFEGMKFIFEIV
jgi:hypothetical protein